MAVEIVQRTIAGKEYDVVSIGGTGNDEKVIPIDRLQKIDYKYLNQVDAWKVEGNDNATFEEKYEVAKLSNGVPAKQIFDTRINTVQEINDYMTRVPPEEAGLVELTNRVDTIEGEVGGFDSRITDAQTMAGNANTAVTNLGNEVSELGVRVDAIEVLIDEEIRPDIQTNKEAIEAFNSDLFVEEAP